MILSKIKKPLIVGGTPIIRGDDYKIMIEKKS